MSATTRVKQSVGPIRDTRTRSLGGFSSDTRRDETRRGGQGFLGPAALLGAITLAAQQLGPVSSPLLALSFTGIVGGVLYLTTRTFTQRCAVFVALGALVGRGITVASVSWATVDVLSVCILLEGVFLIVSSRLGRPDRQISALVPLSILFCFICVLSIPSSPLADLAFTPVMRFLVLVGSMICVGLSSRSHNSHSRLLGAIAIQVMMLLGASLVDYLMGKGIYETSGLMVGWRLTISNTLAFSMLISVPLIPLFRPFRSALVAAPFWIGTLSLFCLTMSRAPFILVPLDLLLLLWFSAVGKGKRNVVLVAIVGLGLPLCSGALWAVYVNPIFDNRALSDTTRVEALRAGVEGALEYPSQGVGFGGWIRLSELGIGQSVHSFYDPGYGRVVSRNPHNAFVRAALDLGLPGFCVYCSIMASLLVFANRLRKMSGSSFVRSHLGLLISVVNLIVSSLFLDTLESTQMWCLVALCLSGTRLQTRSSTSTTRAQFRTELMKYRPHPLASAYH